MGYIALIGILLMMSLFANGMLIVRNRALNKENEEFKKALDLVRGNSNSE